MTDGRCDPGDVDAALQRLVPFLAAGFRAPLPQSALPAPAQPISARRKKPAAERSKGKK